MTKVMLVEDDKSLREIYGIRLVAEGYDIVSADDGEEALGLAVQEKPDLIISDVMMPKISGFDMLDILRSTPETKDIKVIMMTALSSDDQRQRGESLGANRYLVKSQVGIEDVIRVVHEVLGDKPGVGVAQTVAAVAAVSPVGMPAAPVQPVAPVPQPAPAPVAPIPANPPSMPMNPQAAPLPPQPLAQPSMTPPRPPIPMPVTPRPTPAPVAPPAPIATPPSMFTPPQPPANMPAAPVQPLAPAPQPQPATVPTTPAAKVGERVVAPLSDITEDSSNPEQSEMAKRIQQELSGEVATEQELPADNQFLDQPESYGPGPNTPQ